MNKKLSRYIVLALIAVILFANQGFRKILWWLLPFGSGRDDIIEAMALVLLIGLLLMKGYLKLDFEKWLKKLSKSGTKEKQVILVVVSFITSLFVPGVFSNLGDVIFFGKDIQPVTFISFGVSSVVSILGWKYFEFSKKILSGFEDQSRKDKE